MDLAWVCATRNLPELNSSEESRILAHLQDVDRSVRRKANRPTAPARRLEGKLETFKRKRVSEDRTRDVPGDIAIQKLHHYLDSFGMERTNSQKMFHRAFLGATLAHIYGSNDFERHRTRILAQNDMEDPSFEVLVVTPRRWGKTTSVAMFVAALLLAVPDMWVSVFSTGQRASSSLLEQVCKMVCHVPQGSTRILRRNQEQVFIRGDSPADVRRMYSYPSSVQADNGKALPATTRDGDRRSAYGSVLDRFEWLSARDRGECRPGDIGTF
ncbi:hypothetical protein CYMTET_3905 [Cymbomonas tetramitiformis]|uniref:Uncharacterized protein n=1 Tax=Cymbomonas tetramitiformis TaxID=36881 RepID=A0AAE0GU84_9CHLO|nr:hypothetical protein CYMTET_7888 [Cymbomonas tetramitiformis]KAK3288687.1 hypothetical protein CYMTET_3905 [Cymbomonas tetramitiformis]